MLSACLVANCIPAVSEIGGFIETNIIAQAETTDVLESGKCGENATYTYNQTTKTLTISGTGQMYDGYEGSDIEDEVYYYNFLSDSPNKKIIEAEMENIVIGNEITNIGDYAFIECKALKEVKFGKKVKDIGWCAFCGCTALKEINWTDKIEKIETGAFKSCENLANFYVGKSMEIIDASAFLGCDSLKEIKVHKSNKHFSMRGNMLLNKKQTKLILGCFISDTTCHIYNGVTSLNYQAIINKKIQKFEVSSKNKKYASKNGLLYSKNGKTLYLCPRGKMGTATVSDKVTKIGGNWLEDTFKDCDKLETIVIGKNVKKLNGDCFKGCNSLKTVKIHKKNKYYMFKEGALFSKKKKKLIACVIPDNETYTIPEGVNVIATDAFNYCDKLKHIVLADDVTDYEPSCFDGYSKIESITLGRDYYNGGNVQFLAEARYLKDIYVSEKNSYYSSVGGVLYNKKQSELLICAEGKQGTVTVSSGTAIIGENAFCGCEKVTDIVLPATVTTIEEDAFAGMGNERTIVFWVPAGMKERYLLLLTSETGFRGGMFVKELQS